MQEEDESTGAYFEQLPRKVTGKTCQSLAPNGDLCGKPAEFELSMHGGLLVPTGLWNRKNKKPA